MSSLRGEDLAAARTMLTNLLKVVERNELAADGALGRQMEAHLRGALAALDAVRRPTPPS